MTYNSIIDCHAHIIDPARFPIVPGVGYTPKCDENGTSGDFNAVLDRHGVAGSLLVQPSCYGTDNKAMIDAMQATPSRFKAIAVVDPAISDDALEDLGAAGVVGVRFNLVSYDGAALFQPDAPKLLERIRELGWFAQVYADLPQWPAVSQMLRRTKVKALVDHFGGYIPPSGIEHPGFQAVLDLGRDGLGAVKLSAPFRLSRMAPDYDDLSPAVAALFGAFGIDRCIWGSDWPFLDLRPRPTYDEALSSVSSWLPDLDDRRKVLGENPSNLFGFKR